MIPYEIVIDRCIKGHKRCFEKKHPVLSSIFIGTAIIMFWRGLWGIMDLYLFPGNEPLSFAVSALVGILLLLVHDGFREIKEIE